MRRPNIPRHTCGVPTGQPRHRPHCTREHRKEEGCWCFLYAEEPVPTARQWRKARRGAQRGRRIFALTLKRTGSFDMAWERVYGC